MKRICIVAGAGPGIGLAVGKRFAQEDLHIAMIARRPEALAEYVAEIESVGGAASAHPADLSDFSAVRRVVEEIRGLGPIVVMIFNAGAWREQTALGLDVDELQRDFALHVTSALLCAQLVVPAMAELGGGSVLFTGGGLALFPQYGTNVPALTASKSALRGLSLAMAPELASQGIRFGLVTVTGMVAKGSPFDPDAIAEAFWELHLTPPEDPTVEVVFDGN